MNILKVDPKNYLPKSDILLVAFSSPSRRFFGHLLDYCVLPSDFSSLNLFYWFK